MNIPFSACPMPTGGKDANGKEIYVVIKKNAGRCKKCGMIMESKHVHDFVQCSCGECAVDGGLEYLRRINPDQIEDMSESYNITEDEYKEWKQKRSEYLNSDAYKEREERLFLQIWEQLQKDELKGKPVKQRKRAKTGSNYSSMFGKTSGNDRNMLMGGIGVRV